MITFLIATTVLTNPIPTKVECTWQKCGHNRGKIYNCETQEAGSQKALAEVIRRTLKGAVVSKCEPKVKK